MQMTTRRFKCGAGLGIAAMAMLACLSYVMAQQPGQNGPQAGTGTGTAANARLQSDSRLRQAPVTEVNSVPQIGNIYDQQTRDLLSKYRASTDQSERDQLVKDLTAIASQEFDTRQESRSQELKNLEEQLKKLQALHERRAKEKDDIVRDRVRHLLRDADGLGWGTDRIGTPGAPQVNESDGFNNIPRGKK